MASFIQLLEELAKDYATLSPDELQRMVQRFGEKALQMGHLQDDGSMEIPLDFIIEAVQSIGSRRVNEALETLKSEQMVSTFESAEALVDRVRECRERKLRQMDEPFQSETEKSAANRQWKEIERMIFGVDFPD